jgi:hypothetical protein
LIPPFGYEQFVRSVVDKILQNSSANDNYHNTALPDRNQAVGTTTRNLLKTYAKALEDHFNKPNFFKLEPGYFDFKHAFWNFSSATVNDDLEKPDTYKSSLLKTLQALIYTRCKEDTKGSNPTTTDTSLKSACATYATNPKNLPFPFTHTQNNPTLEGFDRHVLQDYPETNLVSGLNGNQPAANLSHLLFRAFVCKAVTQGDLAAYDVSYGLLPDLQNPDTKGLATFKGIHGGCTTHDHFSAQDTAPTQDRVISWVEELKIVSRAPTVFLSSTGNVTLQYLKASKPSDRFFRLPLTKNRLTDPGPQVTLESFVNKLTEGTRGLDDAKLLAFFSELDFPQTGDRATELKQDVYREVLAGLAQDDLGKIHRALTGLPTQPVPVLGEMFGIQGLSSLPTRAVSFSDSPFNTFKVGGTVDLGKYLTHSKNQMMEKVILPVLAYYRMFAHEKAPPKSQSVSDLAAFKLLTGGDSKLSPLFFDPSQNKVVNSIAAMAQLLNFYGSDKSKPSNLILIPPLFNPHMHAALNLPTQTLFPGLPSSSSSTSPASPSGSTNPMAMASSVPYPLTDTDHFIGYGFTGTNGQSLKAAFQALTMAAGTSIQMQCQQDPKFNAAIGGVMDCLRNKGKKVDEFRGQVSRAVPVGGGTGGRTSPAQVASGAKVTQADVNACAVEKGLTPLGIQGPNGQPDPCLMYASIMTFWNEALQRMDPCHDTLGIMFFSDCAFQGFWSPLVNVLIMVIIALLVLQLLIVIFAGDYWFWEDEAWKCWKGRDWCKRNAERHEQARRDAAAAQAAQIQAQTQAAQQAVDALRAGQRGKVPPNFRRSTQRGAQPGAALRQRTQTQPQPQTQPPPQEEQEEEKQPQRFRFGDYDLNRPGP